MATAIINSQMDAINESFSKILSDLTTIRPLLKNAAIGAYPTDTASGSIASFTDGAEDIPVKSLSVAIEPIQSGTGDPSPTNIRSISGHTEVNVYRTGKNLFKTTLTSAVTRHGLTFTPNDDGSIHVSGTATSSSNYNIGSFTGILGTTYILSGTKNGYSGGFGLALYADSLINTEYGNGYVFTPINYTDFTVRIIYWYNAVIDTTFYPQIELGSTATDYEPYTGQTYPFTLGQTVYGGTLDVVSGVLTIDRAYATIDNTWAGSINRNSRNVNNVFYDIAVAGSKDVENTDTATRVIASNFDGTSASFIVSSQTLVNRQNKIALISSNRLLVCLAVSMGITTAADFKTWLASNPISVAYELATPTTVQLTPTQVSTLLGQNNIWADAGEVSVVYRADTGLYIDKKLAQALNA